MSETDATQVVKLAAEGDPLAPERLLAMLYGEFRDLADRYLQRLGAGATLQPTELVHEMFLKMVRPGQVDWQGRTHFFAVGATAMRQILVDRARTRNRSKRGGGRLRVGLEDGLALSRSRDCDVLAIEDALTKLQKLNARHARIVELRFFGGLGVEEAAKVLNVSKRTVESDWSVIRAWLRRELAESPA